MKMHKISKYQVKKLLTKFFFDKITIDFVNNFKQDNPVSFFGYPLLESFHLPFFY